MLKAFLLRRETGQDYLLTTTSVYHCTWPGLLKEAGQESKRHLIWEKEIKLLTNGCDYIHSTHNLNNSTDKLLSKPTNFYEIKVGIKSIFFYISNKKILDKMSFLIASKNNHYFRIKGTKTCKTLMQKYVKDVKLYLILILRSISICHLFSNSSSYL